VSPWISRSKVDNSVNPARRRPIAPLHDRFRGAPRQRRIGDCNGPDNLNLLNLWEPFIDYFLQPIFCLHPRRIASTGPCNPGSRQPFLGMFFLLLLERTPPMILRCPDSKILGRYLRIRICGWNGSAASVIVKDSSSSSSRYAPTGY